MPPNYGTGIRASAPRTGHPPWRLVLLGTIVFLAHCSREETEDSSPLACTQDAGLALYAQRIEPLLVDDRPKSCNQCHLSGVDLSMFVRDSPCRTMGCLRARGLVDFDNPDESPILAWIRRAKPESELITEKILDEEYEAFRSWVSFHARCRDGTCTFDDADPCGDGDAGAPGCQLSNDIVSGFEDPGDCSDRTLENLFAFRVYAWRNRCFPCHFESDERVPLAPKWLSEGRRYAGGAKQSSICKTASLETMRTIVRNGYIDLDTPQASLLLLKPLSTTVGGIAHGGHDKFAGLGDPAYVDILSWIARYASCAQENPELPRPERNSAPPVRRDAGPESPILSYCNCMLTSCHDTFHALWGEGDDEALAGCRAAALAVPVAGENRVSGDFIECRLRYCQLADLVQSEGCQAAVGGDPCD